MPERRTFPSHLTALRDIRHFVHETVTGGPYGAADADEVTLAVSEACADAISKARGDRIEIRLHLREDDLVVEVIEEGEGRRGQQGAERPMGHGLPVIRQMMDEFSIEPGTEDRPGTRMRMVRRREPGLRE